VVLSLLLASAAVASGPATRHRLTMTSVCDGQTYTVAVENGGRNVGAAQIVDAFGHAILVSGTSTFTDTTLDVVLASETYRHGLGHRNQATTVCRSETIATVGDFLPPDMIVAPMSADDELLWVLEYVVVLKI
jgi:hypothetical protein